MPDVQSGGLWGSVPGPARRADQAVVSAEAHAAAAVQDQDRAAKAACDRHYAGGERDGWGRALRWETCGESERERWRRIVRKAK